MKPDLHPATAASAAPRDVAANRTCLRCGSVFLSEGFGERICARCKASAVWRSSLPARKGQTRRRSGVWSG